METDIKNRTQEIYESYRSDPTEHFDEKCFLKYFSKTRNGSPREGLANHIKKGRFIKHIQLEYGICFSEKDIEKEWALGGFISRIKELQVSKRSSKASFRNKEKYGFELNLSIFVNLLLIIVMLGTFKYKIAFYFVVVVAVIINVFHIALYYNNKFYLARLKRAIDEIQII